MVVGLERPGRAGSETEGTAVTGAQGVAGHHVESEVGERVQRHLTTAPLFAHLATRRVIACTWKRLLVCLRQQNLI